MSILIKGEVYSNNEINKKLEEYQNLLKLHNAVRSIIDMVKKDDILYTFYEEALSMVITESGGIGFTISNDYKINELEVYILRKMLYIMKERINKSNKHKEMTKHLFHVEGIDSHGNSFISQCISDDICNAIELYRKYGKSVHKIVRVTQVSIIEECRIMDFKIIRKGL